MESQLDIIRTIWERRASVFESGGYEVYLDSEICDAIRTVLASQTEEGEGEGDEQT